MLSVSPIACMSAKVAMIEVGMASAAMTVERPFHRKSNTTMAAKKPAQDRCSSTASIALRMNSLSSRTISSLVARRRVSRRSRRHARAARRRPRWCWSPTACAPQDDDVAPLTSAELAGSSSPSVDVCATSPTRTTGRRSRSRREGRELRGVPNAALHAELKSARALLDVAAGELDVLGGERTLHVDRASGRSWRAPTGFTVTWISPSAPAAEHDAADAGSDSMRRRITRSAKSVASREVRVEMHRDLHDRARHPDRSSGSAAARCRSGSEERMRLTRSRTSCAASSTSFSRSKRTMTTHMPS